MKNKLYTVLHFLLAWLVCIIFNVRVQGRLNEPRRADGPYLVCANHQSVLDPIFICAAMRRQQPHFMAKAELFKVPFLGWLVRKLGAYPVSRGKNDVGAIKRTVGLIESGRSVGMFPQGTRCPEKLPRECKVKFGAGMIAAHTSVQILPVHIKIKNYKWRFLRRVTVIIGKPIRFESFGYDHAQSGEYARITGELYNEICRLGEEAK